MTELYSNHHLKIIQNLENKHLFSIELAYPNPVLLLSLRKFVKGSTCSDDYLLFTFKAYSVEMFNQFCKKNKIINVANMIDTLSRQLKYMINDHMYCFLGYNTENIIVIDGNKFAYLDIDLMSELDEQNITIFSPFKSTDFFLSPELKIANTLPIKVHYKTCYFSLGCLLLYTLLSCDNAFYKEYIDSVNIDSKNMEQIFKKYLENHFIKDTKLYWFIFRCLVQEPKKRSILFI